LGASTNYRLGAFRLIRNFVFDHIAIPRSKELGLRA
jgi:hypothetical protein